MKKYKTILFEKQDDIGTVWLNRPEIHNAFNEVMIAELLDVFTWINTQDDIRIVKLQGKGKSFCAGADLNWMRGVASYGYEQNYAESLNLSKCMYAIYTCKKPTIAVVHGAAIGGANGLLAACDFAYADDHTTFSLSEVKIGIVPACISPYVTKRVGEYGAKELMITGKRIKGPEAAFHKLVNKSMPADELENHVQSVIDLLRTSGPKAMSQCKDLIFNISNVWDLDTALVKTAEMIAEIRASEEGQEGMAAFLEKRKPNWVVK
ncbi:MAG: enoyl-CoA hydratase/isomerase family protein [Bacteroidales bacterium]|nr:enoyl-CoA hydratase/isomerase family protein [Bacteroidales bacterium]MCF8458277.1 enoyl-CoA hydratase/isomerase family protein [Bacteroidales bacterium]